MNYRGNNQQCDLCCGRTNCPACGNKVKGRINRDFPSLRFSTVTEFYELEFICGEIKKIQMQYDSDEFKPYQDEPTTRMAHTATIFFCSDETYERFFKATANDLILSTGVSLLNGNFHQKNIVAIKRGVVHEQS